ncbi:MAG: RNA-binding protein [Rhodocyclaceae bacterium]|nr:RNA-binding protein [Rhodocyclaceae bacterium]
MNSFHARSTRPKPKSGARAVSHAEIHGGCRADVLLVQQGLAATRAAAQRLIALGRVQAKVGVTKGNPLFGTGETAPIQKPAQLLPPDAVLYLLPDDA